jgi:BON domain-containing protein
MTVIALANNDAELERRITNFLCQRRVPGRECLQLNVHGGVVAVSGRIPTHYARWLCIESCRRVAGVLRVIDNVKIEPAVSEQQPESIHIFSENAKCRQHRFNKSAVSRHRPSVPFKWTLAASNCPKLMAAA